MKPKLITPVGKASWPHLHQKSKFKGQKEEDSKYDCTILVQEEDAKDFIKEVQALYEEGLEEALSKAETAKDKRELREASKNLPIKKVRNDDDELTGEISIAAKNKQQPLVVDSDGNTISPKIGSGSKIRMSVQPRFFGPIGGDKNYLTLNLNAVQVIDLVEWGAYGGVPDTAKDAGFDTIDGGYVSEDTEEEEADDNAPKEPEGDPDF